MDTLLLSANYIFFSDPKCRMEHSIVPLSIDSGDYSSQNLIEIEHIQSAVGTPLDDIVSNLVMRIKRIRQE